MANSIPSTAKWPSSGGQSLYNVDLPTLQQNFVAESDKLFVGDDEIDITIVEITAGKSSPL